MKSDTHYLDELNTMLGSLFLFSGLTQQQVKQLTTAIRELGCNAIEWGHKKQVDRIVTLDYRIDPQKVTIVIRDTGPGFNPGQLPHAAQLEDPVAHMEIRETLGLREGGFGILMSRGLVDELAYNATGNEVTLVKYFPPATISADGQRSGHAKSGLPRRSDAADCLVARPRNCDTVDHQPIFRSVGQLWYNRRLFISRPDRSAGSSIPFRSRSCFDIAAIEDARRGLPIHRCPTVGAVGREWRFTVTLQQ